MKTKVIKDKFDELVKYIEENNPSPWLNPLIKAKAEEIKASFDPEWLDEAEHILCDTNLCVEDQVELVAEFVEKDINNGSLSLDSLEDVLVWEPLVGRYTCDEFLDTIGYY